MILTDKKENTMLRRFSSLPNSDREALLKSMTSSVDEPESCERAIRVVSRPLDLSDENADITIGCSVRVKQEARTVSSKWRGQVFRVARRSRVRLWLDIPGSKKPLYPLISECEFVITEALQ